MQNVYLDKQLPSGDMSGVDNTFAYTDAASCEWSDVLEGECFWDWRLMRGRHQANIDQQKHYFVFVSDVIV